MLGNPSTAANYKLAAKRGAIEKAAAEIPGAETDGDTPMTRPQG
jgi:hypothetical protein